MKKTKALTMLTGQPLVIAFHLLVFGWVVSYASIARGDELPKTPTKTEHTTWTWTYLKATAGNKVALRDFVEKNWFAMDAVAVENGLFKSYRLIENLSSGETAWDWIVAVEYFGDQSYADIRDEFEDIRSDHETVLIDGKRFAQLGRVIRSERVRPR